MGPVWRGGTYDEEAALASCYRRCLELATVHDVKTIAFPAISTGIYGFPRLRAATIAVRIIHELADASGLERVLFCCFDQETAQIYERMLAPSDALTINTLPYFSLICAATVICAATSQIPSQHAARFRRRPNQRQSSRACACSVSSCSKFSVFFTRMSPSTSG